MRQMFGTFVLPGAAATNTMVEVVIDSTSYSLTDRAAQIVETVVENLDLVNALSQSPGKTGQVYFDFSGDDLKMRIAGIVRAGKKKGGG